MTEEGAQIKSFQSMTLDLPPSCVGFCPRYPSIFLVGTYFLDTSEAQARGPDEDEHGADVPPEPKQAQSKSGSIIVFELKDGQAHIKETVSQPSAVFDLHFAPQEDQGDICAAVSSTGTISLFRLTDVQSTAEDTPGRRYLQPLSVLRIPQLPEDDSFTSFTWHPRIPGLMAVTTSSGKVVLARVQNGYKEVQLPRTVLNHDAEAWCAAFSPISHRTPGSEETLSVVFSGGDDFRLLVGTHAIPPDADEGTNPSESEPAADSGSEDEPQQAPGKRGIQHDAGVTAILPLRLTTSEGYDLVITGSYSDHLSVWGIVPPHKTEGLPTVRRLLRRRDLGGGVWRLKVIEELSEYPGDRWTVTLLVSCMHAGARIVRLEGDLATVYNIEVLWRFEEHQSMNYGSDYRWVDSRGFFGEGEGGKIVCVSISFYDKKLCLWTF